MEGRAVGGAMGGTMRGARWGDRGRSGAGGIEGDTHGYVVCADVGICAGGTGARVPGRGCGARAARGGVVRAGAGCVVPRRGVVCADVGRARMWGVRGA